MKNIKFKSLGYHGTDMVIESKDDIDFKYNLYQDHFLGCGFYLWRDSPHLHQLLKNKPPKKGLSFYSFCLVAHTCGTV